MQRWGGWNSPLIIMHIYNFSGALNYVNACPNQPEPSKVFCADHCKCAESRGVPTSLKEFTKYSKGMWIRTSRIPYCIMLLSSMLECTENPNWMKNYPLKTAAADCQGKSCIHAKLFPIGKSTSLRNALSVFGMEFSINGPETNPAAVVDQAAITTLPLGTYLLLISTFCLSVCGSFMNFLEALLYLLNRSWWQHFTLHYSTTYTALHYSTLAPLHSTSLDIFLPWLYFTLLDSTLLYIGSTSFYLTLHYTTMAPLRSTWLYHGSTSLYLPLHSSTMALLHSTWLYIILLWLYFTAHYSIHYSTMVLLHCTWLYITQHWLFFTLLHSTYFYHGST